MSTTEDTTPRPGDVWANESNPIGYRLLHRTDDGLGFKIDGGWINDNEFQRLGLRLISRATPPTEQAGTGEVDRSKCKPWCGRLCNDPAYAAAPENTSDGNAFMPIWGVGNYQDPGLRWCMAICRDARLPPMVDPVEAEFRRHKGWNPPLSPANHPAIPESSNRQGTLDGSMAPAQYVPCPRSSCTNWKHESLITCWSCCNGESDGGDGYLPDWTPPSSAAAPPSSYYQGIGFSAQLLNDQISRDIARAFELTGVPRQALGLPPPAQCLGKHVCNWGHVPDCPAATPATTLRPTPGDERRISRAHASFVAECGPSAVAKAPDRTRDNFSDLATIEDCLPDAR